MLKDNIRFFRKSKGLSQEELAVKLNVVRQTISKWEKGLSVPDSEMLLHISEILEIPVSTLIGENIENKTEVLKESLSSMIGDRFDKDYYNIYVCSIYMEFLKRIYCS